MSPGDLTDLDVDMFEAFVVAYRERWTAQDELMAMTVELLDALNRNFVLAFSDPKRPPSLGAPLRIPRPGDPEPQQRNTVRVRDLFRALARR